MSFPLVRLIQGAADGIPPTLDLSGQPVGHALGVPGLLAHYLRLVREFVVTEGADSDTNGCRLRRRLACARNHGSHSARASGDSLSSSAIHWLPGNFRIRSACAKW